MTAMTNTPMRSEATRAETTGAIEAGDPFTLQLFHVADQEAGAAAVTDAPNFSAVLAALREQDVGADATLTLSSGDAYIPGLFFNASTEIFGAPGVADILIQNELGIEAIAFGNHEFDQGSDLVETLTSGTQEATAEDGTVTSTEIFAGTNFPYLSANLIYEGSPLENLVVEPGRAPEPNSIAGSIVIEKDGTQIGVVGATTPTLAAISSPGSVGVEDPFDGTDAPTEAELESLADNIQDDVDALTAAGVDKVILLAHMQQIDIEYELAQRLTDVDIIVAGGSNSILTDGVGPAAGVDELRPGDTSDGSYPTFFTAEDGDPVAVVNTDGNYQYVGRLVIDFDEEGDVIPSSYDPTVSGPYRTDEAGVDAVGGQGLADPEIVDLANQVDEQIEALFANVFGASEVFLNGLREDVRTQETNLGNLTADANLAVANELAAALGVPGDAIVSIKNGGGIRAPIGRVEVPAGGSEAERLVTEAIPGVREEGEISQGDIADALRFNNGLTLVTVTREELVGLLEHGFSASAPGATPGQFPQFSGVEVAVDLTQAPGNRVVSAAIVDEAGNVVAPLVREGEIAGDPSETFRVATLTFLADGGDGYAFPDRERVDLAQEDAAPRTGEATFAPDGTEQDALAEYLADEYPTLDAAFRTEDTPPSEDERIQLLSEREDTVFGDDPGEPSPSPMDATIMEIQGAAQVSPLVELDLDDLPDDQASVAGATVRTSGVVTAVDSNGFYLQDPNGDGDDETSDAIFVFTGAAPGVAVGDAATVTGTVSEFFPGGTGTRNLPTTQIVSTTVNVTASDQALPAAVVIGAAGRLPPDQEIDDDGLAFFNPEEDGADFFESLEAMRVTVDDPLAVAPTNAFGEIFTVADGGAGASGLSDRGTLNIAPDDFNPERIQIDADSTVSPGDVPLVDVGARLGDVTGVVGYEFGNYQVIPTEEVKVAEESQLAPEVTSLGGDGVLTVASYNVLNLDPVVEDPSRVNPTVRNPAAEIDDDVGLGRITAIAEQIVANLGAPDIVGLQEIQDNDGAEFSDVTAADATLQALVDAIVAAGGPRYEYIDTPDVPPTTVDEDGNVITPVGGQPGGNIRNAFLYNPEEVDLVKGSVQTLTNDDDVPFFEGRIPLIATFTYQGEEVTVVNNHFSSKGGSAPIVGTEQPFDELQEDPDVNGALDQRRDQAAAVGEYVEDVVEDDPEANLVVLGDLNEFEFVSPIEILEEAGLQNLTEQLPENERYSYIFQGNSQSLDHILASESLAEVAQFDAVHVNAEFAEVPETASDHDPLLAAFDFGPEPTVVAGGPRNDVLVDEPGDTTFVLGPFGASDRNVVRLGATEAADFGANVILDFDVNSGGERSFDTLAFELLGQSFALSSTDDFLSFASDIASDGDEDTDALLDGDDLVFAFGDLDRSVRLTDVVGRDGLTREALLAQGVDEFVLA